MLKEHSEFLKQIIATVDCLLLMAAFYLAHLICSFYIPVYPLLDYWLMYIGFLGFYLYFAWTRKLFSILQFSWMKGLWSRIIMIFLSAGILGAAILYMFPDRQHSRTLYVLFAGTSFVFIAVEKFLLKHTFAQIRRNNRNVTPIILFGRGRRAAQICKQLSVHSEWGLRVVRKVDLAVSPAEFEQIIRNSYVEEVFFCIPRKYTRNGFNIDSYLKICEEMGRPARVFLNIFGATNFARWEYHTFLDNSPTLISHTVELDPDQLIFKRAFDIVGSLVGISILFATYPILAALIKLTSSGPVFFKQVRVGKNGKRFILYKYRSMHIDAEERKHELASQNELNGAVFKMKNDPRITPVGRILRKVSLDELPQFINVFKGEMSLVGTRPPTPEEVNEYAKWHHRRISIRPGLTGLWQVSGRNKISDFDEIVRLDLKYIDSWSIWSDFTIIIKTLFVLFKREGAY
ncbi:MAG: exopolysaccharide biosynthesis polyprenyl glycosylphosphotransferase [Chitinivibrionales bacterium]|nr:exopolysaccharide biosynthesis polyprenyl glycosylphosphotransferase [Chitinivibrionales bacterium]